MRTYYEKIDYKSFLSIVAFVAANAWLINKGIAKGAVDWFISPVVEETVLFIVLQIFMFLNFWFYPLKTKKKNNILVCIGITCYCNSLVLGNICNRSNLVYVV